ELEDVEPLPSVAMVQKAPGPGERVDDVAGVADEEAGGHVPLEERVIRPEQLRQRVLRSAQLDGDGGHPRLRRRQPMNARIDLDPRIAAFAVKPPVLVDRLVAAGQRPGGLAGPQEEEARPVEGEVKQGEDLLLGRLLEIDEEVAAADEIDARER